jgi:hypothetical protein
MAAGCALWLGACGGSFDGAGDTAESEPGVVDEAVRANLHAAMGNKQARFGSQAELRDALTRVSTQFKDPAIRKAALADFQPATDHFDRFQVFVLTQLGKVWLNEQVVLSDETLLERRSIDDLGTSTQSLSASAYPGPTVQQNQGGVYKTQGESFVENLIAYKQAGALTQFKKHRKRFGFTGWYDTDASHIAVRVIYFGNPDPHIFPNLVGSGYAMAEGHDHNTNDDYVSDRQICAGGSITFSDNGGGPSPGVQFDVSCYEGIYALHSVDHAGFQWRLVTSTGLQPNLFWGNYGSPSFYVPWL